MRTRTQSHVDDLVVDVNEGDVLAGKYRVDRVLGVGGMGVVVQATHMVLDNRVALKFLLPEYLENEATTTRFLREAQAVVRIKSPHVARVTDVGKLDNGAPFMVMEYLEGQDLGTLLEQEGPIELEQAIDYILQACEAVAAAHAGGIIHRDIKPANLFLTLGPDQRPVVKVLDFGISKLADHDGIGSLTQTHTAMGSPLYMSPEQMRSAKTVDSRTDIWSLGVVLYEMLTGTLPFMADAMPELCALILETRPPSMKVAVPDLPDGLDEAVLKAIARKADERYQDIGEFAAAIAPYGGQQAFESARRVNRILKAAGLGSDPGDGPLSIITKPSGLNVSNTSTAFGTTHSGRFVAPPRRWIYGIAAVGIALISVSTAFAIYRISASDGTSPPEVAASVAVASHPPASADTPLAPPTTATDDSATTIATSEASAALPEPKSALPTSTRVWPRAHSWPSKNSPKRNQGKDPKPANSSFFLDDRE